MYPKLGLTRNVVRRNYALITPDGYVPSVLPGWTHCTPYVLISPVRWARGSRRCVVHLDGRRRGPRLHGRRGQWFFYVMSRGGKCNGKTLAAGGYVVRPGGFVVRVHRCASAGHAGSDFPQDVGTHGGRDRRDAVLFHRPRKATRCEAPFLGDPRARLKTLCPTDRRWTWRSISSPTIPARRCPSWKRTSWSTGCSFLDGGGVYRLDEDWHPVQAGDALWIASYCPQWFIAAGPGPARDGAYLRCGMWDLMWDIMGRT